MDHVSECNDCGAPLVAEDLLPAAEAAHAAGAAHPYRGPAASDKPADAASSARLDVTTGVALILGSIAISAATYAAAIENGGVYFVAVGPFFWGLFRLMRGLGPRPPAA